MDFRHCDQVVFVEGVDVEDRVAFSIDVDCSGEVDLRCNIAMQLDTVSPRPVIEDGQNIP